MRGKQHRDDAFTRIELLVVGLILVILLGVLMPQVTRKKRSAELAACLGNLKQVVLAELLWINDNEKWRLSWQISTNEGGTLEYLDRGKLFPHFKALSNELVIPTILTCPADKREVAKGFGTLDDSDLSYFVNLDYANASGGVEALEEPSLAIIFGDRNVTNNGGPRAGIISVTMSNYNSLGWDSKMHNNGKSPSQTSIGNVASIDGNVATVTPTNLQKSFKYKVITYSYDFLVTNRLALP